MSSLTTQAVSGEASKREQTDRVDREPEWRLSALAQNRDGLILDSRAMACLYEGPLIENALLYSSSSA